MRLLFVLAYLAPLSAFAETLQIKLPSLPLTISSESVAYDEYSEKIITYYKVRYRVSLTKAGDGVLRVGVTAQKDLDYTLYADGTREEPEHEKDEPDLVVQNESSWFSPRKALPYEGVKTPYLSFSNCTQEEGRVNRTPLETLKTSYNGHRIEWDWEVMFPEQITEARLQGASVEINQGGGLITLSLPNLDEEETRSLTALSNYNVRKHFPFCFLSADPPFDPKCLVAGIYDLKHLNVVSRQEKLIGREMTPLQRKVFKKSRGYHTLLDEMKGLKKGVGDLVFCTPLTTETYNLKSKGLDISSTLVEGGAPSGLRFSNLGARLTRSPFSTEKGSPEKTFVRMSETEGLALEQKTLYGCFQPTKEISFKKTSSVEVYKSPFLRGRFKRDYHFLESILSKIVLQGIIYSVDRSGFLKKHPL